MDSTINPYANTDTPDIECQAVEANHGFDSKDALYLSNNFSAQYLRSEVHKSNLEYAVCMQFGDADADFWLGYGDACAKAIKLKRKVKPPPTNNHTFISAEVIKERVDLVDYVGQFVALRRCGNKYVGCCPLHNENHPSFFVYPEQQSWHCYGCNIGGDIFDFVKAFYDCDFKTALKYLGGSLPWKQQT